MSTLAPIVYGYVEDANATTIALTGDKSKLIKYYSDAYVRMSATPQNSDTAIDQDMYIIRNGNNTIYGQSGTFYNVESNEFRFSAEDSNGNIGTATVKADMINYIKLTCNSTQNRPDANGNITVACSGKFFNQSFGAVSNTLTVQFRYKEYGGTFSSPISMTVTTNGNNYSAYCNYQIPEYNYQLAYTFEITATDNLMYTTSTDKNVISLPMFHWGKDDFQFEVPVKFNNINKPTIMGDLRLQTYGSATHGNTLYFGDADYAYIQETTDDALTIKANRVNINASQGLYVNGSAIGGSGGGGGTWTPKLLSSAVWRYDTQVGWYQKNGSVVTIGWMIKAECNSGYHTTDLEISGAPFTPVYAAFGGGIAHYIYIQYSNFAFEGWGINTSRVITPRLQPTNTVANNLQIASTCGYPSGGGLVSLSGTICYMTS